MNLDDKSLFLDAMEDVQPLKCATDVHWHPTRNQRVPQRIDTLQLDNFLTTGFLDIVPLNQRWNFAGKDCNMECLISYAVANIRNRPA